MNYPITLHRDRYPSPHCAHAWICSWYLLLVYTRYYSNPTAVLCSTGNITLFAHKEHNHGFPDFPVQQYSYFLFSTGYISFSRGCQAFHVICIYQVQYQVYFTVHIGILQFYTHLVHLYVVPGIYVQQYTC